MGIIFKLGRDIKRYDCKQQFPVGIVPMSKHVAKHCFRGAGHLALEVIVRLGCLLLGELVLKVPALICHFFMLPGYLQARFLTVLSAFFFFERARCNFANFFCALT